MRILKVSVEGFGVFSSPRSFDFRGGGLNVVFGDNESGKSTVMEAIYATLFGFDKKETERAFTSWASSKSFSGSVDLGGPGWTVTFTRDFSSNEVSVVRSENGRSSELFRGDASPRSRGRRRGPMPRS